MRLLTAADWIMAVTTLNSVADYLLCCAMLCCAQECYGAAETAENGALCRCLVHGSERWRSVDRRTV